MRAQLEVGMKRQSVLRASASGGAARNLCRGEAAVGLLPVTLHPRRSSARLVPGTRDFRAARIRSRRCLVAFSGTSTDETQVENDTLQKEIGGTAVYLVGMMGSGKSTVGKLLAEKLRYRFFDTDDVIEKSLGATVSQIFDENGEEVFRDIETKVLQELSQYARSVISTGGGAVLSRENWGNMRHGIVVWLSGTPQTLASRIHGQEKENRPLLNDVEESEQELVTKMTDILEKRQKFYEEADIVVHLDDEKTGDIFTPEKITVDIMERMAKAIEEKKREVEEKKDFKIEGLPDSMEVREPYETTASPSSPKGFQKK